jgi:hypothetical protein
MDARGLSKAAEQAPTAPPPSSSVIEDRRRPGRQDASPHLIPLLRDPIGTDPDALLREPTDPSSDRKELAPAIGILVGLALSVPLWGLIGALMWAIWRFAGP